MRIALEGPINARTGAECKTWREEVIGFLGPGYLYHNPMDFDCRGGEDELEKALVAFDTTGIASSDVILVMADKPGWGTAMAVQMAWSLPKEIVTVCPADRPSPRLKNLGTVMFKTLSGACDYIRRTHVTA